MKGASNRKCRVSGKESGTKCESGGSTLLWRTAGRRLTGLSSVHQNKSVRMTVEL